MAVTMKEIAADRLVSARKAYRKAETAYNKVEIYGAVEEQDLPPEVWAVIQKAHQKMIDRYVDVCMASAFAREMGAYRD